MSPRRHDPYRLRGDPRAPAPALRRRIVYVIQQRALPAHEDRGQRATEPKLLKWARRAPATGERAAAAVGLPPEEYARRDPAHPPAESSRAWVSHGRWRRARTMLMDDPFARSTQLRAPASRGAKRNLAQSGKRSCSTLTISMRRCASRSDRYQREGQWCSSGRRSRTVRTPRPVRGRPRGAADVPPPTESLSSRPPPPATTPRAPPRRSPVGMLRDRSRDGRVRLDIAPCWTPTAVPPAISRCGYRAAMARGCECRRRAPERLINDLTNSASMVKWSGKTLEAPEPVARSLAIALPLAIVLVLRGPGALAHDPW